jgi:3-oxoacyl-[acyl-carrier-protein] synthase-1
VRDPSLDTIDLVERGASWRRDVFLSNSFAFGGSNTTVAIGRA